MKPILADKIVKIISKFNQNKSPGHDDIGNFIVKNVAHIISGPLADIFNLSLSTGSIPEQLKVAKVIPIYKKKMLKFSQITTLYLYYLVFRKY